MAFFFQKNPYIQIADLKTVSEVEICPATVQKKSGEKTKTGRKKKRSGKIMAKKKKPKKKEKKEK